MSLSSALASIFPTTSTPTISISIAGRFRALPAPFPSLPRPSGGVAQILGLSTEDSITLMADWENNSGTSATAVYTSAWIAAKAGVHSQQRFFALHHEGEVRVDQAHRGYHFTSDQTGYLDLGTGLASEKYFYRIVLEAPR